MGKSMFGGSPTNVFGPTVLAYWTTLRQPAVLLLCFGGALHTMELERWLLTSDYPFGIFRLCWAELYFFVCQKNTGKSRKWPRCT